jgi:ribosomal protein L40E
MTERGMRSEQGEAAPAPVSADAVCERCGTVNPEDTLFCRNCGNNLREQRARRLNEAPALAEPDVVSKPTRWLGQLLTVFGLLLILWTGLNVGRIEAWLLARQTPDAEGALMYFRGADAETFNGMAALLGETPLDPEAVNRALAQTSPPEEIDGRYVIMGQAFNRPVRLGEALVRREGDELRVVALFENGVELRGKARVEKDGLIRASEIGLRFGDEFASAHGFAQRTEGPGFFCYGFAAGNDQSREAMAYRVEQDPSGP